MAAQGTELDFDKRVNAMFAAAKNGSDVTNFVPQEIAELINAVNSGDTNSTSKCLEKLYILKQVEAKAYAFYCATGGKSALELAVMRGDQTMAKLLLAKGANPKKDYSLHIAAGRDDVEMVQLLIDHGATCDETRKDNIYYNEESRGSTRTPLWDAIRTKSANRSITVVEKLLELHKKEHPNERISDIDDIFAAAIKSGHPATKLLLEKGGANPNSPCLCGEDNEPYLYGTGYTLLGQASIHNNVELIKAALGCGANINCACELKFRGKPIGKFTPLELAIKHHKWEAAKFLVDNGAEINIADEYKNTPLIKAAKYSKDDLLLSLLEKNANVNAQNTSGRTSLIEAVNGYHTNTNVIPSLVDALLLHKANPNLADNEGNTALHHAVYTIGRQPQVIEKLIKAQADPNIKNKEGNTPLMIAVARGDSDIVEELLKAPGINLKLANVKNQNALSIALDDHDPNRVEMLLKAGVPADVKNSKGHTLAEWLTECKKDFVVAYEEKKCLSPLTKGYDYRLEEKHKALMASLERIQAYIPQSTPVKQPAQDPKPFPTTTPDPKPKDKTKPPANPIPPVPVPKPEERKPQPQPDPTPDPAAGPGMGNVAGAGVGGVIGWLVTKIIGIGGAVGEFIGGLLGAVAGWFIGDTIEKQKPLSNLHGSAMPPASGALYSNLGNLPAQNFPAVANNLQQHPHHS